LNESLFKSSEGERLVRESNQRFLKHWPVPNEQLHIPTAQGSTFVVVSGAKEAPPLLLLHGSAANSAMWMGDVRIFAMAFRAHRTHLHELSVFRKVRFPIRRCPAKWRVRGWCGGRVERLLQLASRQAIFRWIPRTSTI